MKRFSIYVVILIAGAACRKNIETSGPAPVENKIASASAARNGGGGSGGGGNQPTGLLSGIGGAFKLIGGNNDSIQVNFTQAAPAAGWTVSFTTSDPAVQLPATFAVPAGTFNLHVPLTSSVIPTSKNVTIAVKLGTETKSYVLKVFPLHVSFPAPQLQSPGNGTGIKNRLQLTFKWGANANAYYHDIQVSDNISFTNPMLEVYLDDPIWAASYFNGLGRRYWRVRYIDGSGAFGPWSEVRNFEVKP